MKLTHAIIISLSLLITSNTYAKSGSKPNSAESYCSTVKNSKVANELGKRLGKANETINKIEALLVSESLMDEAKSHDAAIKDFLSGYPSEKISQIPVSKTILASYEKVADLSKSKETLRGFLNELWSLSINGIDNSNRGVAQKVTGYINGKLPCNSPNNCPDRFIEGPYLGWFSQCAKSLVEEESPLRFIFVRPYENSFEHSIRNARLNSTADSKKLIELFLNNWGSSGLASWAETGMNEGKVLKPKYVTPVIFVLSEGTVDFELTSPIKAIDTLQSKLDSEYQLQKSNQSKREKLIAAVRDEFKKARDLLAAENGNRVAYLKQQERERAEEQKKLEEARVAEEKAKKVAEAQAKAAKEKKAAEWKAYRTSPEGRLKYSYKFFQLVKTCHEGRKGYALQWINARDYSEYKGMMSNIERKLKHGLKGKDTDDIWAEAETSNRNHKFFGQSPAVDLIATIESNNRNAPAAAKQDCDVWEELFVQEAKVVLGEKKMNKGF